MKIFSDIYPKKIVYKKQEKQQKESFFSSEQKNASHFHPAFFGNVSYKVAEISKLKTEMKMFPQDIEYRKNLLINAGQNSAEYYKLRSIIGVQELKHIMQGFNDDATNYCPGQRKNLATLDSHNLKNLRNGKYRANLHIHTDASDGAMSISDLLNQASKYATKQAKKMNANSTAPNAPFTIAITDHDGTNSAKQAIDLVLKNPNKYKHLRIVLGAELTSYSKKTLDSDGKPLAFHILTYGIDPNDKSFDSFIESKKNKRHEVGRKMIELANIKYKQLFNADGIFSYEEAKKLFSPLEKGILNTHKYIKGYIDAKFLLKTQVVENPELNAKLKGKGLHFGVEDHLKAIQEYFYPIDLNVKPRAAKSMIPEYLSKQTNLPANDISQLMEKRTLEEKPLEFLDEVNKIVDNFKIEKNPNQEHMYEMDEIFDNIKPHKNIIAGIAHPIENVEKVPTEHKFEVLTDNYKNFKEKGKEQAAFSEVYYQSYKGDMAVFQDSIETKEFFNKTSKEYEMSKTGSLDNHGLSIFKRF